jgi:hypothetical protein
LLVAIHVKPLHYMPVGHILDTISTHSHDYLVQS